MTNTDDSIREESDLIIAKNALTEYSTIDKVEKSIEALEWYKASLQELYDKKENPVIKEMIRISKIHLENLRRRRQFLIDMARMN